MAEKKRKGRRAYLEDFKPNAAGEYIYYGAHYAWGGGRKRTLARLWLLSAASFCVSLANGCIPGTGMDGRPYVVLPYVAALIGAFSQLWAVGRLSSGGDPLREYVYEATVKKLPLRAVLTAVCAGVAILGELAGVVLTQFSGGILFAILFMALETVVLAASFLLRRTILRLEWTKK